MYFLPDCLILEAAGIFLLSKYLKHQNGIAPKPEIIIASIYAFMIGSTLWKHYRHYLE